MLKTFELWYSIIEREENGDYLDGSTQKVLYKIAKRMINEDFSHGDERVLAKKIIQALGFKDGKELRKISKIKYDIDFILECIKQTKDEKHKGSLFSLFSEPRVTILRHEYTGHKANKLFYRKCTELKLSKKERKGRITFKEIQFYEEPFEKNEFDSYRSTIIDLQANEKIKQYMKKRPTDGQK